MSWLEMLGASFLGVLALFFPRTIASVAILYILDWQLAILIPISVLAFVIDIAAMAPRGN